MFECLCHAHHASPERTASMVQFRCDFMGQFGEPRPAPRPARRHHTRRARRQGPAPQRTARRRAHRPARARHHAAAVAHTGRRPRIGPQHRRRGLRRTGRRGLARVAAGRGDLGRQQPRHTVAQPTAGRAGHPDPQPDAGLPRRRRVPARRLAGLDPAGARRRPHRGVADGDPRGRIELREALTEYLGRVRGVRTSPDSIVICAGTRHAVEILGRVFADPGPSRSRRTRCSSSARRSPRWACRPRRSASTSSAPSSPTSTGPTPPPPCSPRRTTSRTVCHCTRPGAPPYSNGPSAQADTCSRTTTTASSATTANPSARCRASTPTGWSTWARRARACPRRCGWAGWCCPTTSSTPVIAAVGGQQFYVNGIAQLTMADFISRAATTSTSVACASYRRRRDRLGRGTRARSTSGSAGCPRACI